MAYCNECGAYIPDGQTKCLACGYDEAEASKKAAEEAKQTANAYDYKYEEPRGFDSDFLRQQLEEQRRRARENSRKWAETEKAQRERVNSDRQQYRSTARSTDTKKYTAPTNYSTNKILSALSYFGILFVLPYLLCQNDSFARFHAKQGMILFLAGVVADIAASIFGLGWLVTVGKLYFIYKGVRNVFEAKMEKLPYIGNLL